MDTDSPRFDNRLLHAGPRIRPAPPRVLGAAWSPVMPTPVTAPRCWPGRRTSPKCSASIPLIGEGFARVFGGNALYAGMQPWAANYGGHQFGHWAGQLGDGRAISLGELVAPDGRTGSCS
jgi:uncharacterized protein YdiU (UPF0061 family)